MYKSKYYNYMEEYFMAELGSKEKAFIEEVSRKFITGKTMEAIAEEIGIGRATAFRWKKEFKTQIEQARAEEFVSLDDKVLGLANDLLDSSKMADRVKGADLYFKTKSFIQYKPEPKKEITPEEILKELGV